MVVHDLVWVEHNNDQVKLTSLHAISAARKSDRGFVILVVGHNLSGMLESLRQYGASAVLVADDPALAEPLADRNAEVIATAARSVKAKRILGVASTLTKDVLPRAAALLDLPMVSDVLSIEQTDEATSYVRPIYAGSALATVEMADPASVLTVRSAAFQEPAKTEDVSPVVSVEVDATKLPDGVRFVSREEPTTDRPELTEADVVVCGGRPLKDKETFDRLIGGLADALGGATGAMRAAVDAGIAPNDSQIGQTGKVIAAKLYIAAGVSGSVQHVSGIKDARTIVAINKDPDAPIFQVATYGIVGDLFEILPEMIHAVERA